MQKVMESEMKSITAGDIVCEHTVCCPECGEEFTRHYIGYLSFQVAKALASADRRKHLYDEHYGQFL